MLSSFLRILEHSPKSLQDPMSEAIYLRLQPVEAPVAAAHCSSPPPPTSLRSVFQSQSLYSQGFCTCCHSSWKLLRIPSLLPASFALLTPTCPSGQVPAKHSLSPSTSPVSALVTALGSLTACQSLPLSGRPCVRPAHLVLSCPLTHI